MSVEPRRGPALAAMVTAVALAAAGCTSHPARATKSPSPSPPVHARSPANVDHIVVDSKYPRMSNPSFDALHYGLRLDFDGTTLHGTARIRFRAARNTRSLRLDLSHRLRPTSATLDGRPTTLRHRGNHIAVATGALAKDSRHTLSIRYAGEPGPIAAPSKRGDTSDGLGWITERNGDVYTFQEPYGALTWFPCNDTVSDEATYDATITTHDGKVAVFNGVPRGQQRRGATTTREWHLASAAPTYLITIAIGDYREHRVDVGDGMSVSLWVRPRDHRVVPDLARQVRQAFPWLVRTAGPYPFDSLGIVIVDGLSGMETQTMITLSARVVMRGDATVEHEMAHQWFGDAVTPEDWSDVWLNEGFATWMQQAFQAEVPGWKPMFGGIDSWRRIDDLARAQSGPPGAWNPHDFAELDVYLGPAMLLDEIRRRVGDEAFGRLLKGWVVDHESRNVTRADFTRWWTEQSGRRLVPLIDEWLDSPTTPRFP